MSGVSTLDEAAVEARMEKARERLPRRSKVKTIVRATDISTEAATEFVGFDTRTPAKPPSSKSTNKRTPSSSSPTRPSSSLKWVVRKATPAPWQRGFQPRRQNHLSTQKDRRSRRPRHPELAFKVQDAHCHRVTAVTLSIDQSTPGPHRGPPHRHPSSPLGSPRSRLSQDAAQQGSSVSPGPPHLSTLIPRPSLDGQLMDIEEKVNASIQAGDTRLLD